MKFIVKLRDGVEQMVPYQPGKPAEAVEREYGIKRAVKLASNENPYGPSPLVIKAIKKTSGQLGRYPDGSCYQLREALAQKFRCQPNTIILGNGTNELLILLGLAVLNKNDQVLTSDLTFVVYPKVAQLTQAELVTVPLKKQTYDLDKMAQAITDKTKLIFIANPNNPTGTALEPMQLIRFIKSVPTTCLVVLDEAYYEYMDQAFQTPSLEWVRQQSNLVILRTFSKAYGLADLRLGYGLVAPELYQAIERVREPFNVNSLAQVAGLAALQDQLYMEKCVKTAKKERTKLSQGLSDLGLKVIPSQANFIYVDISGIKRLHQPTGQACYEKLITRGMIIRPMPGPFVRITVGKPQENKKLLAAFKTL